MKPIMQKISLISACLFLLLSCALPGAQDNGGLSKSSGQDTTDSQRVEDEGQTGSFEITKTEIGQDTLTITASSTAHPESLSVLMQILVRDGNGTILTEGPGGWVMKQDFTNGQRIQMTVTLPLPEPGLITIEGIEMINIAGIIEQRYIKHELKIPEQTLPAITAIDIDIQQEFENGRWHEDFEAIGYVTLDTTADITAVLYALDANGNEIPGDRVTFNLPGHKSGQIGGSHHIVHNSQEVTCVLEIYHNGRLLTGTPFRKSKIPVAVMKHMELFAEIEQTGHPDAEGQGYVTLSKPAVIHARLRAYYDGGKIKEVNYDGIHHTGLVLGIWKNVNHNGKPVTFEFQVKDEFGNLLGVLRKTVYPYR